MPKLIDIDKVFKEKNPSAYRWTPKIVTNYIKRIVHEEELNDFMERNKDKYEEDFLKASLEEMQPVITYRGLENIPESGGAIVVSNHPLGGLDGIALLDVITSKRPDARFLVNDILMGLKNFGRLFVPVNKMGKNSAEYSMGIEEAFESDEVVILFPAGLVSRRNNGQIMDLQWKKGFVTRAVKYKKDIYPTYIQGKLSNRFYNLSNFRTRIGIKANIELIYLPDEMYKQRGESIDITIGKKVPYTSIDLDRYSPEEWSDIFRNFVYTLKDDPESDFDTFVNQYYN